MALELILRPNAAGDLTECLQYPASSSNYDKVDEVTPDEDSTYVYHWQNAWYTDLYNLPASGGAGTITAVRVYVRHKRVDTGTTTGRGRTVIKTNGVQYNGSTLDPGTSYVDAYTEYATNPQTSSAWTWDEVDALQAGYGVQPYAADPLYSTCHCTQVWIVVYYQTAPTVTTQAPTGVTSTGCTGNGNITDDGGLTITRRGFCYKVGQSGDPTVADSVAYDDGSFGEGAYTKAISGLSPGTYYRVRAYCINAEGTSYGTTEQILTVLDPPTNIAATDGTYTDKVTVTWTKSTGATGYRVYRDDVDVSGLLGDVATYDDTGATGIVAGTAAASDGVYGSFVALAITGSQVRVVHTYYVKAVNASTTSAASGTNTGYRGIGNLTYQWQRSAGDSDASYSDIAGGITPSGNDYGAPAYPAGRYYRCVLNATGATQVISAADRGYRKSAEAPRNQVDLVIKNPAGETLYYLPDASGIGYDFRVNELGLLDFTVPAGDAARAYLVYPNEAWLYVDGELVDIFKIIDTEGRR